MTRTPSCLLTMILLGCGAPSEHGAAGERGDPGTSGEPGMKGDKGDKGDPGAVEPALSLLTPPQAFAGRSVMVQLSGVATHFAEGSIVEFDDPAIKAEMREVGSRANLRALVSVGEQAKMGRHTVTVTTKGAGAGGADEKVTLQGGFTVAPSLIAEAPAMDAMPASAPQGGLLAVTVLNADGQDNPFASVQVSSGGRVVTDQGSTSRRFSATVLVDALAPAGGIPLVLGGLDPLGKAISYVLDPADKNAPKITARAATALTLGTAKMGEAFATPGQSNLYKVTAAADEQVLMVTYSGLGMGLANSQLNGFSAPTSGKFAEGRVHRSFTFDMSRVAFDLLPKAGDHYLAVMPAGLVGGMMGFGYTVTAKAATAKKLDLKEPMMPDTDMKPLVDNLVLDKPHYALSGYIDGTNGDEDYVRFKVSKSGKLFALTNSSLDVGVILYNNTCAGVPLVSRTAALDTSVLADTTYCLRVSGFVNRSYELILTQEL